MRRLTRRQFVAASAASGLLLAGCGRGSTSTLAFAGAKASMVLNPIVTFVPWMIAMEQGFFAEQQIEFNGQVAEMPSATVIQQVTGNQLQFSLTNPSAALNNAILRGAALIVLGAHAITTRGYANAQVVISNQAWEAGVRTIPDLRGREINIPFGLDSGFGHWIVGVLEKGGLTRDDVKITGWGQIGQLYQAVSAGQLDIAAVSEPGLSQVRARGNVQLLPGAGIDEIRHGAISTYVLANRDWVKANPEGTVRVLMARIRGGRIYTQAQDNGWRDPPYVAEIIQKQLKLSPEALASMQGNPISADLLFDLAQAQASMDFFQSVGSITQMVPIDSYIDLSYAKEANARLQKAGA